METLASAARVRLSPRHRRWRRLLASCDLDLDELPRPLEALNERDFFICGPPRTGTALVTAQLFQPPEVVTVMEPWDAMRKPAAELLCSIREELSRTGSLQRGRLDIQALRTRGNVAWVRDGEQANLVDYSKDTLVGVKFPAFWRYLDLLPDTRFVVCLRHPVHVISSFRRTGGRLAEGLEYDVAFHRAMNSELIEATENPAVRRILLFDRIANAILPHLNRPNVLVVRYERWFQEPRELLGELSDFLGTGSLLPGPAQIAQQPPRPPDAEEWRWIAERCTTIEDLGYDPAPRPRT
jgi:hypothetical protein